MPCVYLPEGLEEYRATSDSSFQLRELETLYEGRSVIPLDPVVAFLDYLVEDYADEWVTKMMFHYRWGPEEGVENASKILPLWNLGIAEETVAQFRTTFAQRQIDRLGGVVAGSLEVTGPLIEASYERLIAILREHFEKQRFTFGARPSAGDFGLQGQLTQLIQVEPTSMSIARACCAPCSQKHSGWSTGWQMVTRSGTSRVICSGLHSETMMDSGWGWSTGWLMVIGLDLSRV